MHLTWLIWNSSLKENFTYNSDSVVKKWFSEHDDVQDLVDVNLFKDGNDGDGVDGGDEWGEKEGLQNLWRIFAENSSQTTGVQWTTDG